MTIRSRLTLLFTAIVSGLLFVFCLIIYLVAERHRESEFRDRLRIEARTSAELLFGKETISPELFKLLDRNQITVLNQEEIIIYNYLNRIVYESGTDYLKVSPMVLNKIRLKKEVYWREGPREIVGILFTDRFNRFVVIASAVDKYGFSKQRILALILATGWLLAVLVVFAAGRFYAGRALKPIQRIVDRIDEVTASQLNLRLDEGRDEDEITQLGRRFNRMLDRLEEAFRMQRSFVSHASHELRTPLTAITGQLQVSLMADDDPAELRATMQSVLDDIQSLNRLTNGLLSLANVSLDESAVRLAPVSVTELLWQVRDDLRKSRPDCTVRIELAQTNNSDAEPMLNASAALLHVAFINLMENGAKFSPDHRVDVRLSQPDGHFEIAFHNVGSPIPPDELPEIFKPFRRGTNSRQVAGHGIGLSLTERIVRLHQGRITVESTAAAGTTFTLTLPR